MLVHHKPQSSPSVESYMQTEFCANRQQESRAIAWRTARCRCKFQKPCRRECIWRQSQHKISKFPTLIRNTHLSSAFQCSQNAWSWMNMTSKRNSRCFVLVLAPDASASTRLPCLVYINVPLSSSCKIRYVSKFTAASRGCPAIARLSCLNSSPKLKQQEEQQDE